MPPLWVKFYCWARGHWWAANRRGAPVTEFAVCLRCGKLGVRL